MKNKSASACYHCGLPLPASRPVADIIRDEERLFCCEGCRGVALAIHRAGLEGFYDRTSDDTPLAPPPHMREQAEIFDIDDVQAEFADTGSHLRQATLFVEGIHCAACVWLIEQVLETTDGVEGVVNLAGKKLRVRWDNRTIPLSGIINKVGTVGYAATPYSADAVREGAESARKSALFRIGVAGFCAMNMMWISIALWTGAAEGEYRDFFRYTGMALALTTILYPGFPFFKNAFLGLKHFYPTMDLPIAIGASATFLYSAYIALFSPDSGEVYFDTVVAFLFIILIGRYLETASRAQAVDTAARLMHLQPKVATVLRDGAETAVHVKTVKEGEIIRVKPGERIALDAEVVEGESELDESIVTGESNPVKKSAGALLLSGTINGNGSLTARVVHRLADGTLSKMARLIDEAQATKAPTQRTAEKIVPWFVVGTIAIALLTFYFWRGEGMEKALLTAVSVLIITCPCALGLATPMAVTAATSLASRLGVLVKNGAALETLAHADRFAFDKTGALTEGKMRLIDIIPLNGFSRDGLLSIAASVESHSEHRIAGAVMQAAEKEQVRFAANDVSNFAASPGNGVTATWRGTEVLIGSEKFLRARDLRFDEADMEKQRAGVGTVALCAIGGKPAGILVVGDSLREGAKATIDFLREQGAKVSLLTGDTADVARAIVDELHIADDIEIGSEMKPEDKYAAIVRYQEEGGETVAMIGDGVNDAPALVKADVGVAIGSGADVSTHGADIVLTGESLYRIVTTVNLSRLTYTIIRHNIAISLLYNAVFVPMAVMGMITPVVAAIIMPLSSLTVIGNTLRIRKERIL